MAVVVGYVPTAEGRAALRQAAEECKLRNTRLVVINSQRGGNAFDTRDAARSEEDLQDVRATLDAQGLEHEVRQLVRGLEPAEDLIAVAEEVAADLIVIGLRRRSPGRQAHPRVQRAADPARRAVPRARRQGPGRAVSGHRDAGGPKPTAGAARTAGGTFPATRSTSCASRRTRPPTPCSHATRSRCSPGCCSTSSSRWSGRSRGRRSSRARMGRPTSTQRAVAGADPEEFAALMAGPPAVHRYPGAWPARVQALAAHVVERYGGDAARLWRTPRAGPSSWRRLRGLPGFGDQKARIFVALLGKQFGVRPAGWEEAAGDYAAPGAPLGRRRRRRDLAAGGARLQEGDEGRGARGRRLLTRAGSSPSRLRVTHVAR